MLLYYLWLFFTSACFYTEFVLVAQLQASYSSVVRRQLRLSIHSRPVELSSVLAADAWTVLVGESHLLAREERERERVEQKPRLSGRYRSISASVNHGQCVVYLHTYTEYILGQNMICSDHDLPVGLAGVWGTFARQIGVYRGK